jgi:hypothetical protein
MLSRYRSPVAVRSPLVRSSVEDCDVIGSGLRRAFFSGYNSHLRALSRSAMLGVVWAVRDVSSTVSWLSEALEATLFDGCYGGRDRRVRSKLRFASTKSRNAFCDLNAFRRLRILLICGLPESISLPSRRSFDRRSTRPRLRGSPANRSIRHGRK